MNLIHLFMSLICFVMGLAATSLAAAGLTYPGNFSQISATSPDCNDIFVSSDLSPSLFFITSPRGAVLRFPPVEGGAGIFSDMTLVGSRGYNDLFFKKRIEAAGWAKIEVTADGFGDYDVLYLEFEVRKFKNTTDALPACSAKAEFAGFPS